MTVHLVHIPKTGGTALSTLPGICRHAHEERLSDVPDPALIVLRDPVARFISAFDMYHRQRHLFGTIAEWVDDLDHNLDEWGMTWERWGHAFRPMTWWLDDRSRDVTVIRTEWLDDLYGDALPKPGEPDRNEARPTDGKPRPRWWEPSRLSPEHEARVRQHYAADYDLLETLCQP